MSGTNEYMNCDGMSCALQGWPIVPFRTSMIRFIKGRTGDSSRRLPGLWGGYVLTVRPSLTALTV